MRDKVYDNNSSIEFVYLTLISIGNWVSCWWEKVYDLTYWKRNFMKLHTCMLCKSCRKFLDLSLDNKKISVSFFNYLTIKNLSDTSINTNTIYANLISANSLRKRIWRSITSAIQKRKNTIWTTQVPILNWMDLSNKTFNSWI